MLISCTDPDPKNASFLLYALSVICYVDILLLFFAQYTSVKPLGDRVLVKINTSEEVTVGGILLPTTSQSKPQAGEVVAVGDGRTIGNDKVQIGIQVCLVSLIESVQINI